MRNFFKICEGFNIEGMNFLLNRNPELWNKNTLRKEQKNSPHLAISDIWLRYNDDTEYKKTGDYSRFHEMHYPNWYPSSNLFPMIRGICLSLMAKMGATHLGGVLITKIPPGGKIEPHIDSNWHANFYNCKLYIPIKSNRDCINRCEDEFVVMNNGECWYFNNNVEHEVINNGDDDRITLIICMRVE
jgi:hypothetical protein